MRVAVRDDLRLHVLVSEPAEVAAGPGIVLVHGLASNARLWDGVAARLSGAGHRVLAVDQRGHGHSERHPDGYDLGLLGEDLLAVADTFDLARPVVVGQSWGATVVLELAARHPERVAGVVCVDGGYFDLPSQFEDADAAWAALTPPDPGALSFAELTASFATRMDGWPQAAIAAQLSNLARRPDGRVEPVLRRADHEQIVRGMYAAPPGGTAPRVDAPVLLLPAASDDEPDPDKLRAVQALAGHLGRVDVRWLTNAHHDVHAAEPDRVADAVLDALRDGRLGEPQP